MRVIKYEYNGKSRKYDVWYKVLMQYNEIHMGIHDIEKYIYYSIMNWWFWIIASAECNLIVKNITPQIQLNTYKKILQYNLKCIGCITNVSLKMVDHMDL